MCSKKRSLNNAFQNKKNNEEVNQLKKSNYKLSELVSQCKPENRHEVIDFGVEGKELI